MRTLFGVPQDTLLVGVLVAMAVVAAILAAAAIRNPLLPRLAWRNVPRRPGFAALITLGLTIGTVILSSAFTTGDTMSQSVRTVVAGVLGSADEVVFVPAPVQRSGFDLAQSIATGSLLTGVTDYIDQTQVQQITSVLGNDPRVQAVIPVALEQAPVSGDTQAFAAQINLLGVPANTPFAPRDATSDTEERIEALQPDSVYINTEAANALGVTSGQTINVYAPPNSPPQQWHVQAVTRLGDLGGGEATVFVPLDRLQALVDHPDQVNEVLVINAGGPTERLNNSWPLIVELRAAFLDDNTARRLARAMSSPPARDLISRAISNPDTTGRLQQKLQRLQADIEQPNAWQNPEFKALAQDPEVLSRLANRLPNVVTRGNTPFAAAVAGPGSSFRVIDVQSIAQDQADRWGSAFTDLFVVLGAFSLFSGTLLIVLVFSLVALERRTELGISRALGARRRDVILLLALEGGMYSVISSLFGLGGGLALALAIIALAQGLVEQYGFHLEPVIQPASIGASYGLGVILTFVAVSVTAWRSSRFSIVTAIRDLPDPPGGPPGRRSLVLSALPFVVGPALVVFSLEHRLSLVYAVGIAVAIVGAALLARWVLLRLGLRGPERIVFTLAGLALIGWWVLPIRLFPPVVEMSFLSGVTMLLGAVWVLAYNVGILRRLRLGAGRGMWRLSTAYVAANRFRTGLTLTMFALVVLSLTLSAVMLTATRVAYADPEAVTGGWDIRVQSSQPPRDLRQVLADGGAVSPDVFTAIGTASPLRVEGIQTDTGSHWQSASVLAVDDAFAQAARTPLTGGDSNAWQQLTQPGTAIIGGALLTPSASRLQVSDSEGRGFHPVTLWLRDLRSTQPAVRVQVVGVADARGPFGMSIIANQATFAGWPAPEQSNYYLAVPPGANARELAAGVGLSADDLKASTIGDELRLVEGVRGLLNMILQGFMGVGLVAGVAALGTLSTRAVVERRRQIGVLRALGFSARAISVGLLLEATLVALLGAVLGVAIGLFVAQNTVTFLSRLNPELRFAIPWDQLAGVVLVALAAALLMTLLPARQAGGLTPAEALREA
ncbi:MAG: ABC transporter permease [Chloroflexi bacterium]|nr:ABC transporter permease [Chloroflexota bacterium]